MAILSLFYFGVLAVWIANNVSFCSLAPKSRGNSVQFSSVIQLCPTLCDPMNCSTQGLLVHHQIPEYTQTHVH